MDRRSFVTLAVALGGGFSFPVNRCLAALAAAADTPDEPAADVYLDAPRKALLSALSEHIIPQTDTPGAIAAGVPDYIEFMLLHGFDNQDRDRFLAGLDNVEQISMRESGSEFLLTSVAAQIGLLEALEAEGRESTAGEDPGFFQVLKELTLIGYYTSEAGATLEARYVPMPGRYDACLPLKPDDRAFSDATPLDSMV